MNPYHVLGVPPDASQNEIKSAYRKLVKEYHPDRNSSEAARNIIVRVNEAYEILSNPERKAIYDRGWTIQVDLVSDEERQYHEYREAFKRKRGEEDRKRRERQLARQRLWFGVLRFVSIGICLFALLLVIDQFLPSNHIQEKADRGWQLRTSRSKSSRGELISFMHTEHFTFGVPHQVHLDYDYFGQPGIIDIEYSPLFKVPKTILVQIEDKVLQFEAGRTVFSFLIPWHYLLLVMAMAVSLKRDYHPGFLILAYATLFVCLLTVMFMISSRP